MGRNGLSDRVCARICARTVLHPISGLSLLPQPQKFSWARLRLGILAIAPVQLEQMALVMGVPGNGSSRGKNWRVT